MLEILLTLLFIDAMLFLSGNKSVIGWILDKLGW